jgi:hypothetical protein
VIEYLKTHPEQVVIVLLTLLTAIAKPRTPEQYAAMPPRLAALLKFLATVLPDVVKAAHVVPQVVTGKSDPAKDPFLPSSSNEPPGDHST